MYIGGQEIDALQKATNRFMDTVTDPKAEIILNYASSGGMVRALIVSYPMFPPAQLSTSRILQPCSYSMMHQSHLPGYSRIF